MVGPEKDSRALIFFLPWKSHYFLIHLRKRIKPASTPVHRMQQNSKLCDIFHYEQWITLLFLGRQCHLVAAGGGWIRTWLCSQRPCTTRSFSSLQETVVGFLWEPRTPQRRGSRETRTLRALTPSLHRTFNTIVYFFCTGEESNRNKVLIAVSGRIHSEAGMAECHQPAQSRYAGVVLTDGTVLGKPVCGVALYI